MGSSMSIARSRKLRWVWSWVRKLKCSSEDTSAMLLSNKFSRAAQNSRHRLRCANFSRQTSIHPGGDQPKKLREMGHFVHRMLWNFGKPARASALYDWMPLGADLPLTNIFKSSGQAYRTVISGITVVADVTVALPSRRAEGEPGQTALRPYRRPCRRSWWLAGVLQAGKVSERRQPPVLPPVRR